eukprot:m.199898 g.199898  ORF g.199898 m.199898 type:complete len:79 (-) comp16849_c0_seq16:2075-2311(-)
MFFFGCWTSLSNTRERYPTQLQSASLESPLFPLLLFAWEFLYISLSFAFVLFVLTEFVRASGLEPLSAPTSNVCCFKF